MPGTGEVKGGSELGYKTIGRKYKWSPCLDCGKERWVILRNGKPQNLRCKSCNNRRSGFKRTGSNNALWKGGRGKRGEGYIEIWLHPNDFFHPMAGKKNRVAEHRLVLAKYLNRCLLPWEVVHHKNGIRDDNRLENLELLSHNRFHLIDTITKSHIQRLEKENQRLKSKIQELVEELEECLK